MEGASILVVDDNPLIANVIKSLLAAEDCTVFLSSDGKEATDLLTSKHVDVIICDVMMPVMDGFQLHHWVREKPDLSHIPFVFLTALSDSADVKRGQELGADEYLTKPFDPANLVSIVRGKVKRSRELRDLSEKQFDSYRKRVIHTLSHEFRTPLVAINTGAELLIEQGNSLGEQRMHDLLEAIRRGGERLERLVTDFMLMQQIEAGIAERLFQAKNKECQLSDLISDIIARHTDLHIEQGFTLKLTDHTSGYLVRVYEPHIMDIMRRLIENAVKFSASASDKSIEIQLVPIEKEVAVEVCDRGIGIDPARVKEAIDIFGQLDRDKIEQQGGGLGLAIANRYAKINGGRIEFEQRSGGGSVVSLVLPGEQAG